MASYKMNATVPPPGSVFFCSYQTKITEIRYFIYSGSVTAFVPPPVVSK
jgi:hypothetical protein